MVDRTLQRHRFWSGFFNAPLGPVGREPGGGEDGKGGGGNNGGAQAHKGHSYSERAIASRQFYGHHAQGFQPGGCRRMREAKRRPLELGGSLYKIVPAG